MLSNRNVGQVTDAGLMHVEKLTSLKELYLRNDKISDAGLQYLKGLTKLQTLDFFGTNVSPAGLRELKKSLPNTRIDSGVPARLLR